MTGKLLHDLYGQYKETKEVCDMCDHSLVLDIDEYIEEKERLQQELAKQAEQLF